MHSFISISHEAAFYSFTVLFLNMCSAVFDTLERLGESKERRRKTWSCEQRTNKWCAVADTAKVARQKYSLIGKANKGRNETFFSTLLLASSYGYGASHLLHLLKENNNANLPQGRIKMSNLVSLESALRTWNGRHYKTPCHCFPQRTTQMNLNGKKYPCALSSCGTSMASV